MRVLVPVGLYLLALAIRLIVANELPFPTAEPSAYYVGVAQNLVAGSGLVSDGVWSYATPPLEVPKPAFELWLPMSTFVSALAMSVLGSTFWAAQVGGALLGAAVAPLAWAVGREAARTEGLDARRGGVVAITSGLLAAVLSPLVLGSVVPDSYIPFTVFMLAGALLVPRVIGVRGGLAVEPAAPSVIAGLGLGIAMGLAYLSRQEVIWLGLTFVLMLAWALRAHTPGTRLREAVLRLWPVFAGGLVVVVPWLLRNWVELGSPFPGQAVENMFLVENEDIFAFSDHPGATTYFDQGLATVLWNPVAAAWDNFINVIALPAFPVGLVGLIALVGMRRSPALRQPTTLVVILVSAAFTFGSTIVLFPVATLWGTFMHASGPLLVALGVLAALGGDALLARISRVRRWEKPNVVIAPIALVATAGLLTVFQVQVYSDQSRDAEARYAALTTSVVEAAEAAGLALPNTVITDHPMWVADALDGYAVALPDEDLGSILELSEVFETTWVIVIGERGRYPEALLDESARECLSADPLSLETGGEPAWLFQLAERCEAT
ncbi:MAG: hypothetical protein U9O18_03425 [Chloroflexota bacterium]|nr:hypothetical protein [Chloroflexota bacterium]